MTDEPAPDRPSRWRHIRILLWPFKGAALVVVAAILLIALVLAVVFGGLVN